MGAGDAQHVIEVFDRPDIRTVYYTGSDTLYPGYLLCFNSRADATSTVYPGPSGTGTAIAAASESYRRTKFVGQPAAGNLYNFAGIVRNKRVGRGPVQISIPYPNGTMQKVVTDQSCTIDTTLLTVQAGSYYAGGVGEGPVIGKACQTIDRSSTAGTVQALCVPVNPFSAPFQGAVPSSTVRNFSPKIWETCPWNEINNGTVRGHAYFNDFVGNYTLANNQSPTYLGNGVWGTTAATAGSVIRPELDEPYGVMTLESTTDNEDALASIGGGDIVGNFVFSSTTKLWMEARIKVSSVTTNKMSAYVGFAEEALLGTTEVLSNTGALADKDYVGFHFDEAATTGMDTTWNTASGGTSPVVEGENAVTLAADTYTNVGLHCDGTTVYFYQNGAALSDSIAIATADFPDGEEMAFYLAAMMGHGDTNSLSADYVRIAQQLA